MTNQQIQGLTDDLGTPIRWKMATLVSVAGLVLTLIFAISGAGAKSERLDTLSREMSELRKIPEKIAGLETWKEEVARRLSGIEATQTEILREVRRRQRNYE